MDAGGAVSSNVSAKLPLSIQRWKRTPSSERGTTARAAKPGGTPGMAGVEGVAGGTLGAAEAAAVAAAAPAVESGACWLWHGSAPPSAARLALAADRNCTALLWRVAEMRTDAEARAGAGEGARLQGSERGL